MLRGDCLFVVEQRNRAYNSQTRRRRVCQGFHATGKGIVRGEKATIVSRDKGRADAFEF